MPTDLRYPIGPFVFPDSCSIGDRHEAIARIKTAPARFRAAVAGLDDPALDTPYRPDGWTVRQVVHHVADSHIHAYVRCKLALTEDHPTIRPYDEAKWAELPDSRRPLAGSLGLLDWLHERWVGLLEATAPAQFARTFYHPEGRISVSLDRLAATYAWHGDHHLAHITELRRRQGW